MLTVGLGELNRTKRIQIDAQFEPDDPLWTGGAEAFETPLAVSLTAQLAGSDVVVRGHVTGTAVLPCRRCVTPVRCELAEEVTLVFQPGLSAEEAGAREVYPLPPGAGVLELSEPVREHVLLAVPRFALCKESCRGLCPRCGTDLNVSECTCGDPSPDERWAALRDVRFD